MSCCGGILVHECVKKMRGNQRVTKMFGFTLIGLVISMLTLQPSDTHNRTNASKTTESQRQRDRETRRRRAAKFSANIVSSSNHQMGSYYYYNVVPSLVD